MATIDNIITLIEKGYSKDEIDNLLAQNEVTEPEPDPVEPEPSQEPASSSQEPASSSQEPATEPEPDPADDPLKLLTQQVLDLTKQVRTMTAAVQLQNVKSAEQPAGNSEMIAEDFLARLINPNLKEENN